MRPSLFAAALLLSAFASLGFGASSGRTIRANGVAVSVPGGWQRVAPADPGPVTDPVGVIVVGTTGVRARASRCEIAAYRVQPRGAVVVVVRWQEQASGGSPAPGRAPLAVLTSLRRRELECFGGRAASAYLVLRHHGYQVNVMVGDRASARVVRQSLAVGRSFRLVP